MIPGEFHLVEFNNQNAKECVAFMHNTIKVCYPEIYAPEVIEFFLDYHTEKALKKKSKKGKIFLLYKDNLIVASGYLYKREVGGVYVHPDFQRQGIGKIIVGEILNLARSMNFDHVWLDSTPIAFNFYKSMGFTLTEERTDYVNKSVPLHYYRMFLKL
ncbi:MAG: GNAT family N-acetyltransferase [Bacteroidales bacterium]|nr:GNAT family N-acetyltransferase [Bacteroidales bacterium]MBN2821192.1 GNAT family N-acetyltransferase [Bacteroidales bacterium]